MPFVLDASVAIVWALADEDHPLADLTMLELERTNALVPPLWWYEVRNVLIISERRKRLSVDGSGRYLKLLEALPIETDEDRDQEAILLYARKHQLSLYDAVYLDVAKRNRLPLATLDKALRAAAQAASVPLLA